MISQLAAQVPDLVAFPLVGLLAGLAIGLTGMGGGVLLTPIMVLFLGVPPNVAVSNDLLISLAVKPVGALTHSRAGTVRTDMVLKYLIGGTLLVAAAMMIVRLLGRTRTVEEASPPVRTLPTVAIGVVGGLLVGMTSVGSGSLMLVLLSALYPTLASRTLVGTDLAQAIPLVAAAALGHVLFGDIRLSIVAPVLVGAFPGVWLGSRWSVRMPEVALRPTLLVMVGAL